MDNPPDSLALRRAALPEVLRDEDVSLVTGQSRPATRKAIIRGDFGRWGRVGRQLLIRRDEFLAALAAREIQPMRRPGGAS